MGSHPPQKIKEISQESNELEAQSYPKEKDIAYQEKRSGTQSVFMTTFAHALPQGNRPKESPKNQSVSSDE